MIWNNVDLETNLPYHLNCMKVLINETTSMTNCSVIGTQTKTHQCVRACTHTKWHIVLFHSSLLLLIDIHYTYGPYRNQRCFDCFTMSIHVSLCTVAIVLVQRWILIFIFKKTTLCLISQSCIHKQQVFLVADQTIFVTTLCLVLIKSNTKYVFN